MSRAARITDERRLSTDDLYEKLGLNSRGRPLQRSATDKENRQLRLARAVRTKWIERTTPEEELLRQEYERQARRMLLSMLLPKMQQSSVDIVVGHFRVSMTDICSSSRTHRICRARRVLHYLLHTRLEMGLAHVGALTNKDHTTVMRDARRTSELRDAGEQAVCEAIVLFERMYGSALHELTKELAANAGRYND